VRRLIEQDLVDEYRLLVFRVVIGVPLTALPYRRALKWAG
jgi:hypothetical protein